MFGKKKIDLTKFIEEANAKVEYTKRDAPEVARSETHNLFVCDDMQLGRRNCFMLTGDDRVRFVSTAFTEAQFHLWLRMPDTERKMVLIQQEEIPVTSEEDKKKGWFNLPSRQLKLEVEELPFRVHQPMVIPLHKHDQNDTTEWSQLARTKNRHDHWAKIKGELWCVPAERIYSLDRWMYEGNLFIRERIVVEIPQKLIYTFDDGTSEIVRVITEQEAYMYVGIPDVWEPQLDGGYNFRPVSICSRPSLSRQYYAFTKVEEDPDQ